MPKTLGTVLAVLLLTAVAAAVALAHMNSLAAYIIVAPGYLVQAWLFETHRALGGFGYQATMVGVSALVWTLIILAVAASIRVLIRMIRRASP